MNIKLNLEEKTYRHAKFLNTLNLNENETKLVQLFLKSSHELHIGENLNLKFEDNALNTSKIAVEF